MIAGCQEICHSVNERIGIRSCGCRIVITVDLDFVPVRTICANCAAFAIKWFFSWANYRYLMQIRRRRRRVNSAISPWATACRLLSVACRLSEITDMSFVEVDRRPFVLRSNVHAAGEFISLYDVIDVVEDSVAVPEDLFERCTPCLDAPAGVRTGIQAIYAANGALAVPEWNEKLPPLKSPLASGPKW